MRRSAGSGRSAVRLASIRYSVGAWQRTLTPSASARSSRSAGSKRPVVDDRRGAGQPGGEEDVAGRLRPARRGRAPDQLARARAEPVLGLRPLAGQVAVGVDDAARLAGRAGGEDDQRRVLGVHRLDRGRASPAGGPRRGSRRPRPGSSPARRRAARRAGPRRRRRAPARRRCARSSRSWRRSCGLQGRATAPIRQQASSVSAHSIRLPTRVITTSPRSTPRAAKAPESPAERAISSPKCQSRRFALGVDGDDPQPRGGGSFHHVLDEVHGRQSAAAAAADGGVEA